MLPCWVGLADGVGGGVLADGGAGVVAGAVAGGVDLVAGVVRAGIEANSVADRPAIG